MSRKGRMEGERWGEGRRETETDRDIKNENWVRLLAMAASYKNAHRPAIRLPAPPPPHPPFFIFLFLILLNNLFTSSRPFPPCVQNTT